jgi:hypothetical protein
VRAADALGKIKFLMNFQPFADYGTSSAGNPKPPNVAKKKLPDRPGGSAISQPRLSAL